MCWLRLFGRKRSSEPRSLRHQLNVLRRQAPSKPKLMAADRLVFVALCRLFPSLRNAITIVQPDTVLRWHRSGSGSIGAGSRVRAVVALELRSLIRRMSVENPLWGAPRIQAASCGDRH
jgi:hypothetical protein